MKTKEQELFEAMTQAIEEREIKELEYLLAKRNAERLTNIYRAYVGAPVEKEVEE